MATRKQERRSTPKDEPQPNETAVTEPPPLSSLQEEVAWAFGNEEDTDRLEAVFGLKAGTIDEWLKFENFFRLTLEQVERHRDDSDVEADYARGLEPAQQKVAYLMVMEGMSQKDASNEVGVSDRRVRDWEKDWIYARYKEQLENKWRTDREEDFKQTSRKIRTVIHHGTLTAAEGLVARAEDGEIRAQIALVAPWLKKPMS